MKVTTEQVEDCVATVTIEVDEETVKPTLEKVARQASGRFQIPGFRKGRAPYAVVARLVGEQYLRQEALEEMAPALVERALTEQGIEPYGRPKLTEVKVEPTMQLTVSVPLAPKVELGDYRSIHIEPPSVEVTDEQVQQALDAMRRERAVREPIDRPLQVGDWVTAHVAIRDATAEEAEEGEAREQTFPVPTAESEAIPGLSEHLVGANVGDTIEFEAAIPSGREEDATSNLAHVKIVIDKAEEEVMPELNDEFAVLMGDYDNLDALTDEVRRRLERVAEQRAQAEVRRQATEKLVEISDIKYPPDAVEMEMERMAAEFEARLSQQRISLDAYLKAIRKTREELVELQRPAAERRVREALALREFIRAEEIQVSPEELTARTDRAIANVAGGDRNLTQMLRDPEFQRNMESSLLSERGMRRLVSIVTGQPEPAEEVWPLEEMPAPAVEIVEVAEGDETPPTEAEDSA